MAFIEHNSLKLEIFFNPIFITCFSGFMLFRVQLFQGPGVSGSGFRVQNQVLEVAKLQGYKHQLHLQTYFLIVTRVHFNKSTRSNNHGQIKIILTSSRYTEYVQQQVYVKYSSKYTNFCYILFFLHNFKLKTEVILCS